MTAFAGAGRGSAAGALLETQAVAMERTGDNAAFTREVGSAATRAIKAFGDGNFAEAIRLLRPLRSIAHRFGGSHAQRDLLDLTLIEAALRGGEARLAAALVAERVAAKPDSTSARLFRLRMDFTPEVA